MRRILAAAAVALAGVLVFAAPAQAEGEPIQVKSDCNSGWYVNPDEGDLLPTQAEGGLVFDGPSLVHHATDYALSDVPTDGAFVATVEEGVAPLFKLETTNGYSTINKTADGKWWSSKIPAASPGGQSNPVDKPADLIGKWSGYTDQTRVFSFGVGYANDSGNKALVKSITFAGQTYTLTCAPKPPAKPKKCKAYVYAGTKQTLCDRFADAADDVDCKDIKWRVSLLGDGDPWKLDDDRDGVGCEANRLKPTDDPAPPAAGAGGGQSGGSLPVTGASVPVLGGVAALLLVGGGAAMVVSRRRRTRFTA